MINSVRLLQPKICPAVVYQVCRESASRNIMHTIASIWSRPFVNNESICGICDTLFFDYTVHVVSECIGTSRLRWSFISDVMQHDYVFVTERFSMEPLQYTLKLLGANIGTILDRDQYMLFLRRSYKFIHDCVNSQPLMHLDIDT